MFCEAWTTDLFPESGFLSNWLRENCVNARRFEMLWITSSKMFPLADLAVSRYIGVAQPSLFLLFTFLPLLLLTAFTHFFFDVLVVAFLIYDLPVIASPVQEELPLWCLSLITLKRLEQFPEKLGKLFLQTSC